MPNKLLFIIILISISRSFSEMNRVLMTWETRNPAFDNNLYENVLDSAKCERQMSFIQSDSNLRFQFLDAGVRIPKGIKQGNTLDMGDYHGCLGIKRSLDDSTIQGKYCMINVPADTITLSKMFKLHGFSEISEGIFTNSTLLNEVVQLNKLIRKRELMDKVKLFRDSNSQISEVESPINFRMAVCIPEPCTISEALSGLHSNTTILSFQYEEDFCRLPNDKPWALADYVAIALFSLIGTLTIVSTLYDLRTRFIVNGDPKSVDPLYTSFSVYTNAYRLTTFSKNPNALECVDGIRALSMGWIIILHTFNFLPPIVNITDYQNWKMSFRSIWITSAPLAVDTFLMMSGMLLVYTNAANLTSSILIQKLHLFYLNRILRMFPLLAAGILIQASFFHWVSDGPLWHDMAFATDVCRNYWWLNLLFVNNFFVPICLGISWYLAVDMQLHILSPILLYFVLSGSKRQAWAALAAGLLATLTASTVYVFIKQLPGASVQPGRIEDKNDYTNQYYLNTLPRAAPFFVGMIFGYILHLCRQHKTRLSKSMVLLLWCLIIIMGALSLYSPEPMKDVSHDNQTVDSLVNAFARSSWAFAVATLIVICVKGYGGPLNWFLSLQLWKLISRISYAMYLFHYPLILLITGSYVQPIYFSVSGAVYAFFSVFSLSFIVGFIATLVIELPSSTLFSRLLGRGLRQPQKQIPQNNNAVRHEVQANEEQ